MFTYAFDTNDVHPCLSVAHSLFNALWFSGNSNLIKFSGNLLKFKNS